MDQRKLLTPSRERYPLSLISSLSPSHPCLCLHPCPCLISVSHYFCFSIFSLLSQLHHVRIIQFYLEPSCTIPFPMFMSSSFLLIMSLATGVQRCRDCDLHTCQRLHKNWTRGLRDVSGTYVTHIPIHTHPHIYTQMNTRTPTYTHTMSTMLRA